MAELSPEQSCFLRELEARARPLLTPSRFDHTLRTRDMALELGRRWGGDLFALSEAALLHDCTKKLTPPEHLQLLQKYDITVPYNEEEFPILVHADTGALVAEHEFKMPSEVCSAIRLHTLGGENMSLTQKIIYLSDAIERGRQYPGADEIRLEAFVNLDRATAMSLKSTLENVLSHGRRPNDQSVRAYFFLVERL